MEEFTDSGTPAAFPPREEGESAARRSDHANSSNGTATRTAENTTGNSTGKAQESVSESPIEISVEDVFGESYVSSAPQPKEPRRPRKNAANPPKPKESNAVSASSGELAAYVLMAFNTMAMSMIGTEAKLNALEEGMLKAPLQRQFSRMPTKSLEKVSGMMDPVMIVMGFGMWAMRCNNLMQAKRFKQAEVKQQQQEMARSKQTNQNGPVTPNGEVMTATPNMPAGNHVNMDIIDGLGV